MKTRLHTTRFFIVCLCLGRMTASAQTVIITPQGTIITSGTTVRPSTPQQSSTPRGATPNPIPLVTQSIYQQHYDVLAEKRTMDKIPGPKTPATEEGKLTPFGILPYNQPMVSLNEKASYILLSPGRHKSQPPKGYTLLIALHGFGDTADSFANAWLPIVASRSDLIVAVPEADVYENGPGIRGYIWQGTPAALFSTIIDDTTHRDHVNPAHVIIAGLSQGGTVAGGFVSKNPDLFAGYACVASTIFPGFYNAEIKNRVDTLAIYYAVGTKDPDHGHEFVPTAADLKKFGFSNLLTENPQVAHVITDTEITHMMTFFDKAMRENDRKARAIAAAK